jgi:hypothetical protein
MTRNMDFADVCDYGIVIDQERRRSIESDRGIGRRSMEFFDDGMDDFLDAWEEDQEEDPIEEVE